MERLQRVLVNEGFDLGNSGILKDGVDNNFGPISKARLTSYIKKQCVKNKYIFFQKNLYWFRMSDDFTDKFTDFVAVTQGGNVVEVFKATTKPGMYWVKNPVTAGGITGTGCRVEGQTIGSHKFIAKGKRKWGYAGYFAQVANVLVYRDGNKDNKLDKNITQVAPKWFGFFLHAMGKGFSIWNWSAGCMGTSLNDWGVICEWFEDGTVISDTIFEV